jgi:hypothetical protein
MRDEPPTLPITKTVETKAIKIALTTQLTLAKVA